MVKQSMKRQSVLVDLKIAMNKGYCGIATENRLAFKLFSQLQSIKANGLLISDNKNTVFSTYRQPTSNIESIEQANRFFHEVLLHEPLLKNKLLSILKLNHLFALKKNRFDLYKIDPIFRQVIWRTVFNKSLEAKDRESVVQNDFYFSDLTSHRLQMASYFKKNVFLNTSAYDFAIFWEPTPVTVSSNTIKIIRYHDAIPITEPDFSGAIYSYRNMNMLKQCAEDAYFVCNSEPTLQSLLEIKPALEKKAFVVPLVIPTNGKKVDDFNVLKQILLTRLSTQFVPPDRLSAIRHSIQSMTTCDYIFNLAAFDPKKNHASLVAAWERANYQSGGKLKLVIAANPGFLSKETEAVMRSHIAMGNMIHLSHLSMDELPFLFSHAKAFVFPSYVEGFGLPPLEAMQCECPTIVSDIPAHRFVMGDASLYCDPYDADTLADAILHLTYREGADDLRQELIRKGLDQIKKYSEATLLEQWAQLFDTIKSQTN